MAARLLSQKSRLVVYLPSLRSAVQHFRAFSSYDERPRQGDITEVIIDAQQTELPDPQLEVLGIQDRRFPMPGMTGPCPHVQSHSDQPQAPPADLDFLSEPLPQERHATVFQQFSARLQQEAEEQSQEFLSKSQPGPEDRLECVSQECPLLLQKDFQELFPGRSLSDGNLTVITICQKTQNDMSGWNPEVQEEREQLLEQFIVSAEEICEALKSAGYWADFVDPSSGKPFHGDSTNATLFETDERYRQFGFEIDDLGCCKVISHHLWGTHAFVGSLFTNAPSDHPILKDMSQACV